ncbi:MAG: hypothetical protein DMF35_06485 [Verrucomicrobia bacterium]|nr:MAG: hypothetical protein DMF35_06485 [Verrucomicrobiota bacterium]
MCFSNRDGWRKRSAITATLCGYSHPARWRIIRRLSEAILHYKAALQIDPNYPDADDFLGRALLENGQEDEAKIHLEKR